MYLQLRTWFARFAPGFFIISASNNKPIKFKLKLHQVIKFKASSHGEYPKKEASTTKSFRNLLAHSCCIFRRGKTTVYSYIYLRFRHVAKCAIILSTKLLSAFCWNINIFFSARVKDLKERGVKAFNTLHQASMEETASILITPQ